MERQKKKQKGITLIALVISIIVMLILAGVSLNMTIGENGIISQAQSATYMQSCAVLEEYLHQQGLEDYINDDMAEGYTYIDLLRLKHNEWIYKNDRTGLPFLLVNGKIYYLFQKENLPEEIRKSLRGGDAGEKRYEDYVSFNDVYGVTSDLKVYYCANGLDSRIGAADELLEDSATRVALKSNSSSGLAEYLSSTFGWAKTDENGNILAENLSSVKELTIDSNSVKNLKELYNLSSLTSLTLKNASLTTLEGIDLAPNLVNVIIENSTCGDYTAISNCRNIKKLYLTQVGQTEATGVLDALKNMSSSKLEYFGIYDSPEVTDITKMDQVSSAVKGSLKYLYLYGDSYSTASFTNFNNLYELKMHHDVLADNNSSADKSLKTITNLTSTSLQYLYCGGNGALESILNVNLPKLVRLDLQYNYPLTQASIDEFSESKNLTHFYLYRNSNITNIDSILSGNKTLLDLRIHRTSVNNIKSFKGNTTLIHFYAHYNTALTTLEGLENCNDLATVHCEGCTNLGNGADTIYEGNTYKALGKSSTNALYSLSNKKNLNYLNLQNSKYLKYFSYLKDSGRSKVDSCFLLGCNQLDSDEVVEAKTFINKSAKVNMPASLSLHTLDDDTTQMRLERQTMTDADFRALKNKTKLQTLVIGGMTIKNSSTGAILNTIELNNLFNEVLSTCTGITQLYIYEPISDISFVKNMNKLQYIMLNSWGGNQGDCKVGTMYTDSNGTKYHQDSEGNPTGLELLNNYCPDLRSIRIWDYENDAEHHIDLSKIQPAINKMDEWKFADNSIDSSIGFWLNNQWIADTLSKCTEITNFFSYRVWGMTYDLSNCKSLKDVRIRPCDGNWEQMEKDTLRGHIKLPTSYIPIDGDVNPGYYLYMEYPDDNTILSGGAGCRELKMERVRASLNGNGNDNEFAKMFAGLNSTYLKKITIKADGGYAKFISSNFLNNLSNCKSLSEIFYYGYAPNEGDFTDISAISTMDGLTKAYFDKTRISKIPNITNLKKLTYLYIQDSNVVDISGLYKDESTTLPLTELYLKGNSISNLSYLRNLGNLIKLDLRNNSITNTTLSSMFGNVDNVSELNKLKEKYKKLNEVYVRNGNKFDDTSGLSWARD